MGPGWGDASSFYVSDRARVEHRQPAGYAWVDCAYVQKAEVRENGLRGVLEAIGGEPCLGEHVAFDIAGDGLRLSFWRLGLA